MTIDSLTLTTRLHGYVDKTATSSNNNSTTTLRSLLYAALLPHFSTCSLHVPCLFSNNPFLINNYSFTCEANSFFSCSTLLIAGKKCTCPSASSMTSGTVSRAPIGVCVSRKYTKIGNDSLGRKS